MVPSPRSRLDHIALGASVWLADGHMPVLLLADEGSSSLAFVIPVAFRISSSSSSSFHVDTTPDQRL